MPRSRRLLELLCCFIELLTGIEQLKQFSDFSINLVQRQNSKHATGANSG
jgi:hypothetical protein